MCYVDESGTSEIPGNSEYFVLAGIAIPIWHWKGADRDISGIKRRYNLEDAEIHTAWMLRRYPQQLQVQDFENLSHDQRRNAVDVLRRREILRLQRSGQNRLLKSTKKNYRKTESYIHLSYSERKAFITEVAELVGSWGYARLFAECIDKINYTTYNQAITPDYQAFEQVVSRFQHYLSAISDNFDFHKKAYGVIIHDNNDTVAKKHTELMKKFHRVGTFFQRIDNIIETPLFVDSELTSMVQIADLCAYALRRFFENGEEELLRKIYSRADQRDNRVVGVRHHTISNTCNCFICQSRTNGG
ncbi:MAG: DUF3800 domain-containing protein [Opitutales bacterium]|nr:DUF3800 domain-containing protein [Opitutales bacterium]MCH8540715.1 DUF3800 domain-containing protein [Opitutales bacterium]